MENDICKKGSPSMSRNSSVGYYYQRRSSEGVPFKWEMQPGTPINTQPSEIIPPLSPPPAMLSHGFPKPSIPVQEPRHFVFPTKLKLRKWKYIRCKKYFSRLANKMVLPSIRLYPEKRTVSAKNLKTGELEVIYDAKESISGLKPPIVKNLKEVMESESAMVWSEVSEGILNKDWDRARKAKKAVEEKQRESLKQREVSGASWVPKHFSVVKNGKEWVCTPLHPTVPRAPLVITEAQEAILDRYQDSKTLC